MEIMSFNIRIDVEVDKLNSFSHRINNIVLFIQKRLPVIIGLQEPNEEMLNKLLKHLPNYKAVGNPRSEKGEYTAILYLSDEVTLLNSRTFWLSDTPNEVSKFEESCYYRIATLATFEEKNHKQLTIINTHLDYFSEDVQVKQISVLLNESKKNKLNKLVIMGDFNATPSSKIHKVLQNENLKSSYSYEQEKQSTFHNFKGTKVGEPIDYIYLSNDIKYHSSSIIVDGDLNNYLSDHYPIKVEIEI